MTNIDLLTGERFTPRIVVNNQVFLLGLDELYREAMKQLEPGGYSIVPDQLPIVCACVQPRDQSRVTTPNRRS